MTDTYNQLKEELRVYYPGFTDVELNEMTNNLINFYLLLVEIETPDNYDEQED